MDEVDKVGADLGFAQPLWGPAEMSCELGDTFDVDPDGLG